MSCEHHGPRFEGFQLLRCLRSERKLHRHPTSSYQHLQKSLHFRFLILIPNNTSSLRSKIPQMSSQCPCLTASFGSSRPAFIWKTPPFFLGLPQSSQMDQPATGLVSLVPLKTIGALNERTMTHYLQSYLWLH
jgi:hypothetical protein